VITQKEAIAYLLPGLCGCCSARLPGPGEPCEACGKIPEVTRPEAEAQLNSATALAAVEASVRETEAEALFQAAVAKWQEAAQVVHVARLQDQRAAARNACDEHNRAHRLLAAKRARAEKAEDAAAAELEPQAAAVAELAMALDLATKMHHGVRAVAEASYLHNEASSALAPYREALSVATARREEAAARVTASEARGDQLRKALDDTERALRNPGTAPLGEKAIAASPFRLLLEGRLSGDGPGLEIAGEAGRAICDLTGVTEQIVAQARGQLAAEQEAAAAGKALLRGRTADGHMVALPNPHFAGTPQPFHPPASAPHPVQPSTTPGW
jgi:hypothetical protein